MSIVSVNDFVVRFANINGSGSASANAMFAKGVMRMGVPVATRNIFPSNIQGLPTWFEVRVCEAGWQGARGGADLVVAMNPQTFEKDMASIEPGGYLFYDNSRYIPPEHFRKDIVVIGVPLTELCNAEYTIPRERQLFKNIIYIGALCALLDMERKVFEELLSEQFKGKDKLIAANHKALRFGYDWTKTHLTCPIGLTVRRSDGIGDKIYVEGNSAAALGAVCGGATVLAWYPLTPSTSLAEAYASWSKKLRTEPNTGANRYAIVQAEDELASIGMVIGAGWNGARAFTATSGPGVSLMTEFIGLAYFAEIPLTIINVQRGGPSTGMPTRTQQSDLLSCAYASHGDTKHVLVFPRDAREAFEMGAQAFDLADRLQTPVFVMLDLDIGMNSALVEPFKLDPGHRLDRGKVMSFADLEAGKEFGRYLDTDKDGVTFRTYPGTHASKGGYFTRGTTRDEYARYTEEGAPYVRNMEKLLRKFETAKRLVPGPVAHKAAQPTRLGVIMYGSTGPAMDEAAVLLAEDGVHLDVMRVRGFPFCDEVVDFVNAHDRVFVLEQNRDAQLRSLLLIEHGLDPAKLISVLHYDGSPITARFIVKAIADRARLGAQGDVERLDDDGGERIVSLPTSRDRAGAPDQAKALS